MGLFDQDEGDMQSCGARIRIQPMSHTVKLQERAEVVTLRSEVSICEKQYDIESVHAQKSTIGSMFALRMLQYQTRQEITFIK